MLAWVYAAGLCVMAAGTESGATEAIAEDAPGKETVVLLHGLGRSQVSLKLLEYRMKKAGYETLNFPYGVRKTDIAEIAGDFHAFLEQNVETKRYHLVGHSLGNIIIREAFKGEFRPGLGRIVMLAPPNQPAALAQRLGDNPVFKFITKDSGQKLGSAAFYAELPTPTAEFGIIAGDRGQRITFKEPNDGIVAVKNTKLDGMQDWLVLHHTHTFIMNAKDTAAQCVNFLQDGAFESDKDNQ